MKLERILLPTDYSELSGRAARVARWLAQMSGATVHVLHVCQPVEVALTVPEAGVLRRREPPDKAACQEQVEAFARRHFGDSGVPFVTALADGKRAREIVRYAREARVDRIVIGTRGRGLLRRLTRGSVSGSVLEHAPCVVVVVPESATPPEAGFQRAGEPAPALAPAT
ncbi:MAG: universal stress protein [Polyangiaceae bacterium]|nr:universal stress protein [Polyangiaceae bacterium]